MTALYIIGGIFIGLYGPVYLGKIVTYFQNRAILKDIMPQNVDESKLCKTPQRHDWINATTYTDKGPGTTQVCRVCGFIPLINKMASFEAIDRIEENNKIREIEKKIYQDFLNQENGEIEKFFGEEIKSGVKFDKLLQLHTAGMTFGQRYRVYKMARSKDIEKEITRSDA